MFEIQTYVLNSNFPSATILVPAVYQHPEAQEGGGRGRVAVSAHWWQRPRQPHRQPHHMAFRHVLERGLSPQRPARICGSEGLLHI